MPGRAPTPSGCAWPSPRCRRPHRSSTSLGSAPSPRRFRCLLSGVTGQCQEDVIEGRTAYGESGDVDAGGVESTYDIEQQLRAPIAHPEADASAVDGRRPVTDARDGLDGGADLRQSCDVELHDVAADAVLQLVRRARRDDQPVVDDDDLVAELVGLFEVLRREQQRRPLADELADDI